ncbi:MAG: septum formation initiator family protein [Flavobacteriales bacterium]
MAEISQKQRTRNWSKLIRNKYVLTSLVFLVWMTFVDNNDFFRQYKVYSKKNELNRELNRRKGMIRETTESLQQLRDRKHLEKFAREQYLFKRDGEEIFVVVAKDQN